MTGIGHGKVILVGEHAAVYGHAALAGALACGVRLSSNSRANGGTGSGGPGVQDDSGFRPHRDGRNAIASGAGALDSADVVSLRVGGWDVRVRSDEDSPLARAVAAVAEALDVRGMEVTGEADVPPGAGLGSSAAFAVALVRTLAAAAGRTLDDAQVEEIADRAERCFHGNPSGLDVAIAARGGMGLYRRGHGLTRIAAAPVPLAIGLSGQPRSTADMVARVAAARAERPDAVDAELTALGAAAVRAAGLVGVRNEWDHGERDAPMSAAVAGELGEIFTNAHRRLAGLGVSTDVLDEMVGAAIGAGATGAKLTGGGGGGAVIALAPGREEAVLEAWRKIGKLGFVTRVGVAAS